MKSIWTAIAPRTETTRVVALGEGRRPILKANLRPDPQHWKALPSLLEALAFWEGMAVHAALVADDESTTCGTSLFREAFDDFGRTPLYTLDVVWDRRRPDHPDDLVGLGDFRDLHQILIEEIAR